MHNPPHPGETLREDVLPALGVSVTDAAAQLGVTRPALSRMLNGRAAISPEMALRLEKWKRPPLGGFFMPDQLLHIDKPRARLHKRHRRVLLPKPPATLASGAGSPAE